MDINQAIETAKSGIQKQFNVTEISIKSSNLKNGIWHINTSFILNNEQKYYSVNVNNDSGFIEDMNETKLSTGDAGSAPTLVTIAFVIQIIAVISYAIAFVVYAGFAIATASVSTYTSVTSVPSANPAIFSIDVLIVVLIVVFLILLLIDIYILRRIMKIRKFIRNGDYKSAYEKNTIAFGILALIFGGLLTGILLLVARDGLNQASN